MEHVPHWLFGVLALLTVTSIYFLWARKLPRKEEQKQ